MATTESLPTTPQRYYNVVRSPVPVRAAEVERPLFRSPRCEQPDSLLLLSPESLKSHEDRWREMSQQAGRHQQDGSVLTLTRRRISPQSLRSGVTPQVATRVRELRLEIDERDSLPVWMDVISAVFFQLEHLRLSTTPCDTSNKSRMRRLYVLYRMPDLLSIDGKGVTQIERQLARPSCPNGHRVPREDWVSFSSFGDSDESNGSEKDHGDAIEVSLTGAVSRAAADVPIADLDESDWNCPLTTSPEPCGVVETSDSEEYNCGGDTSLLGLALPTFDNPLPLEQGSDSSIPDLSPAGRLAEVSETLSPIRKNTFTNKTDLAAMSCESTPERIIAEAVCSTRSLTFTSPFSVMFRGDGTLEEILERNKLTSTTTTTVSGSPSKVQKVSHARSLSSPFPMQFRKKIETTPPEQQESTENPRIVHGGSAAGEEDSEIRYSVEACLEDNRRDSSLDEISLPEGASAASETPSSPQPRETPDTEGSENSQAIGSKTPVTGTGSRPPPCPSSSRRPLPSQRTKRGKRFACWRSKKQVRSKSIVDEDEDSSTDEEEENDVVVSPECT